jgi:hypothetical protein
VIVGDAYLWAMLGFLVGVALLLETRRRQLRRQREPSLRAAAL